MRAMFELREKMCKELEEINRKPEIGAGDLEAIHKLTDTIKNIDKICMMAEAKEDDYSEGGDWMAEGRYGGGQSNANRGKHYVRGHYSMDRGDYSGRRDARGRYSREDGREEMMRHIQKAVDAAPEQYKEDFRRFMRQLEDA